MSPAAPEATNRASTTPRSDGVARLVGRGGEVATATGRTPRRSMQTRRRLPDGGRPGKRASTGPRPVRQCGAGRRHRQEPFGPGPRPNEQAPRREGGMRLRGVTVGVTLVATVILADCGDLAVRLVPGVLAARSPCDGGTS